VEDMLDGSSGSLELELGTASAGILRVSAQPNDVDRAALGEGREQPARSTNGERWFEFAQQRAGRYWIVLAPHGDGRVEVIEVLQPRGAPKTLAIATGVCTAPATRQTDSKQ